MNTNEYLQSVLSGQSLGEDSAELKDLQTHRAAVEKLLRGELRFGAHHSLRRVQGEGNNHQGILRSRYCCYLPSDSNAAGETLQEIYENVRNCLNKGYIVEEKTSALRLKGNTSDDYMRDFHIDVVPGRFTDESKSDGFIYQKAAEKSRLKTNLDLHIEHVRDSGVIDAIRLLKLWKVRKGLKLKQFVFELLIIDLLSGMRSKSISDQLMHVWEEIAASADPISVEDPANPSGNDLSEVVKAAWSELKSEATNTLNTIKWSGWEAVFGTVTASKSATVVERAQRASAVVSTPNKPWCAQG